MAKKEIYDKFMEVVKDGDEVKAKAFLADHVDEFPEEVQSEIIFNSFRQSLTDNADNASLAVAERSKDIGTLQDASRAVQGVEDKVKAEDIKKQLGI